MNILVMNGPNLNLLEAREPKKVSETLDDIEKNLQSIAQQNNTDIGFFQSNSENDLIDELHKAKSAG